MKKDFVIYRCGSWSCGGLNSGLFACKANTLPLSYNPTINYIKTNLYSRIIYSYGKLYGVSKDFLSISTQAQQAFCPCVTTIFICYLKPMAE